MTRLLPCLIILLAASACYAQEVVVEDRYDEIFGAKPAAYLAIRNQINLEDYTLGLEAGMINRKRNLILFGSFDARPYRKKVIEYKGNNLFYQYREERYFLGVGAEYLKGFEGSGFGAFIQLNPQYTWGVYGGTEHRPDKGWVITPRIGLAWHLKGYGFLKLGYAYLDTKTYQLDKHRVYVTIAGLLTRNR